MPNAGGPELVEVLPNHRFDEVALQRYLAGRLPGIEGGCTIRQFQGGQSNPTYHMQTPGAAYVLRKKPAGVLLASAHAIEREYRVMQALGPTDVPVPRMRLLCEDTDIIGTAFFVMDYLPGRIYTDRSMPGVDPAHRRAAFMDMAAVLARLHRIDPAAVGLADYGRPTHYVPRQIERWTRQYRATNLEPEPAMDQLIAWLEQHPAVADESAIAHGDYRLGNLIIDPVEPRVAAILDWELSTLGHPLADLAYCCIPWRLPPEQMGVLGLDIEGPAERGGVSWPITAGTRAGRCRRRWTISSCSRCSAGPRSSLACIAARWTATPPMRARRKRATVSARSRSAPGRSPRRRRCRV